MTVKTTIMTFAVVTILGLSMITTTANADTVDLTANVANQTTQVAKDISKDINQDGLIETINKNEGNIEKLVEKGSEFAFNFSDNLDDAVSYNKETTNKNIITKTTNFVSILFSDKTKETAIVEESKELTVIDKAKEEVANNDLKESFKQALNYQFNEDSFSSVPDGFAGFLVIGIRTLLAIIIITTLAIAIRASKSSKDRDFAKYQKQLSKLR